MTEASWQYNENLNDLDPTSQAHHLPTKEHLYGCHTSMEPEELCGSLEDVKDGLGTPQFALLCSFMNEYFHL